MVVEVEKPSHFQNVVWSSAVVRSVDAPRYGCLGCPTSGQVGQPCIGQILTARGVRPMDHRGKHQEMQQQHVEKNKRPRKLGAEEHARGAQGDLLGNRQFCVFALPFHL